MDQATDNAPTAGAPHWDIVDSYQYYASQSFGITIQCISSYFRVRVLNQSSSATTEFRLQSILCPIIEALPRSLDENGHLVTSIHHISDHYDWDVENTPTGEMRVAEPVRLVGAAFDGTTVDSNFWTATTVNSATITQANAEIVLNTLTTANGSATLNSARRARYIGGSGMCYRAAIQISAGATNNKRRWGIAYGATMPTVTDGAWFQLNGTTFSIVTKRANAADVVVSSGSFNGNLGVTYTPSTTVATYEIYWTNSKVWFVIGDEVLHTVSASSATWSGTMSNFIFMDNVNSNSATSANTLQCRTATIRRLGGLITQPISKYTTGTQAGVICKYGPGNLHRIIADAGVNGAIVTIYDGTSVAGSIIFQTNALQAGTDAQAIDFGGLPFFTGLFYTVTAQSANVCIVYE